MDGFFSRCFPFTEASCTHILVGLMAHWLYLFVDVCWWTGSCTCCLSLSLYFFCVCDTCAFFSSACQAVCLFCPFVTCPKSASSVLCLQFCCCSSSFWLPVDSANLLVQGVLRVLIVFPITCNSYKWDRPHLFSTFMCVTMCKCV